MSTRTAAAVMRDELVQVLVGLAYEHSRSVGAQNRLDALQELRQQLVELDVRERRIGE